MHVGGVKEAKKHFYKMADKYSASLDKSLALSAKKKDSVVEESAQMLDDDKAAWLRASLGYAQSLNGLLDTRQVDLGEMSLALLCVVQRPAPGRMGGAGG